MSTQINNYFKLYAKFTISPAPKIKISYPCTAFSCIFSFASENEANYLQFLPLNFNALERANALADLSGFSLAGNVFIRYNISTLSKQVKNSLKSVFVRE